MSTTQKSNLKITSKDLFFVINFIGEIDKEVDELFSFIDNQKAIVDGYVQLIKFAKHADRILKQSEIKLDESPDLDKVTLGAKKLVNYEQPVRSQAIAIFAYLESLFTLYLAYTENICDLETLKKASEGTVGNKRKKKFYNSYLLTDQNEYYGKNKKFKRIDSRKLITLRNLLTHFFSVTDEHIILNSENTKHIEDDFYRGAKKIGMGSATAISPRDLLLLTKSSVLLMIEEWNKESIENKVEFDKNISFVRKTITQYGAVSVSHKEMQEIIISLRSIAKK